MLYRCINAGGSMMPLLEMLTNANSGSLTDTSMEPGHCWGPTVTAYTLCKRYTKAYEILSASKDSPDSSGI